MSFLAINGLELPVIVDSHTETPRDIGNTEAAYDGTLRTSRQSIKRDISLRTPPDISNADGWAWERLINGEGHHWSFENSLYSSKGLAPVAGYTGVVLDGTGSKFGSKRLFTSGSIGWQVKNYSVSGCTTLFWALRRSGGVSWDHYAFFGNNYYKNGSLLSGPPFPYIITGAGTDILTVNAPTVFAPAWQALHAYVVGDTIKPTVSTGFTYECTQAGTSGGTEPTWSTTMDGNTNDGTCKWITRLAVTYLDDLVFLPFTMPSSWLAPLAAATKPFSDLPNLTVSGDALGEGTRTMRGAASSRLVKVSGSTINRELSITLQEA